MRTGAPESTELVFQRYQRKSYGSGQTTIYYDVYSMHVHEDNTCPTQSMESCLYNGYRVSYPFWDSKSFGAGSYGQPVHPAYLERLPATVSLTSYSPTLQPAPPAGQAGTRTCPSAAASTRRRHFVAKLGARGQADTTSWPARDVNNQTATTAVIDFIPAIGDEPLGVFRCFPSWRRADGSAPAQRRGDPTVAKHGDLAGGGTYLRRRGEAHLARRRQGYPWRGAGTSLPNSQRRPPSLGGFLCVVSCVITAEDPSNNGLPVYVTGTYLAIVNFSVPGYLEFKPFSFPL